MATWAIMLGTEVVFMAISIIAVVIWMNRNGGKEDELDRRLEELAAISKSIEAKNTTE